MCIDETLFLSKNSYKNTLEMDFEMWTREHFFTKASIVMDYRQNFGRKQQFKVKMP